MRVSIALENKILIFYDIRTDLLSLEQKSNFLCNMPRHAFFQRHMDGFKIIVWYMISNPRTLVNRLKWPGERNPKWQGPQEYSRIDQWLTTPSYRYHKERHTMLQASANNSIPDLDAYSGLSYWTARRESFQFPLRLAINGVNYIMCAEKVPFLLQFGVIPILPVRNKRLPSQGQIPALLWYWTYYNW